MQKSTNALRFLAEILDALCSDRGLMNVGYETSNLSSSNSTADISVDRASLVPDVRLGRPWHLWSSKFDKLVTTAFSCVVLLLTSNCNAGTITEYFNNYGTIPVNVAGLGGAGDGWQGAWGGSSNPDYAPGAGLTYLAPGYSNSGNLIGLEHGAAQQGSDLNSGNGASRTLVGSGFTGTIWASALARTSGTAGVFLFFDEPRVVGPIYASLWGTSGDMVRASVTYNNLTITDSSSTARFPASDTHLMLTRITIGPSNTSFAFWVDPDLSGGESGLPAPLYDVSGINNSMIGTTFQDVGVGFINPSGPVKPQLDAIRVSNELDGFLQVTAVPEPSTLAIACMAALLIMIGVTARRRAAARAPFDS